MRPRLVVCFVVVACFAATVSETTSTFAEDPQPQPVPLIPGSRTVNTRDATGRLGTHTTIPESSAFAQQGGGSAAPCDGVQAGDDPATLDQVEETQPIKSLKWIFIEGFAPPEIPLPVDLPPAEPVTGIPLDQVKRTFSVYCNDTFFGLNSKGTIEVAGTDPLFNPRDRLVSLRNSLQLAPVELYENQSIDTWGGLVVRSPAWLGIEPTGWATQRSPIQYWRGWALTLIAQPRALEFVLHFTPDDKRGVGDEFTALVPCIGDGGVAAYSDGWSMPAVDDFDSFDDTPGTDVACRWTPGSPGTVTITPRITYAITMTAVSSGGTAVEVQPDYTWTGEPTDYTVDELRAVNVNDGG
jgi:hypothetical protein